ncbi:unnamed protein product [Alopecurus aequalis]
MDEMAESERLVSGPNQEFSMLDEIVRKTQRYSEFVLEEQLKKSTIDETALTEEEKWEKEQARLFPSMTDGQLKPYLLKGVKWLISLWQNGLNGILEDEMEYGAVIQTLGFLAHLKEIGLHGPYMIVSSQHVEGGGIPDWLSGIRFFPNMKHLLYFGNKESRTKMRKEFVHKTVGPDFPIILTTYWMVMSDKEWLANYNWKYVVVDQSHQMKKGERELSEKVKHLPWDNKLLLVRSHSMENLAELRSLLKFALPHVLSCHEEFDSWFDFSDKEGEQQRIEEERRAHLSKFHAMLRPFLVRQVEEDVEYMVPQKKSATGYKTKVVQHSNAIGATCSKNHAAKEVKRTGAESREAVAAKVPPKKGATCSDAISVTSSKGHAAIEGARTGAESCKEVAAEVISETDGEGGHDMRSSQLGLAGSKILKRRRRDDALISPLGENNLSVPLQVPKPTSSELIFKALKEIPDLARADILRAYSMLIRDDRQFESLMALPMDMRKDWLLMEIGNKVCSIAPAP